MARMVVTHSLFSAFRSCRQACAWRYLHHLVPIQRDPTLDFGSVVHRALEVWHRARDLNAALAVIDAAYPDRGLDEADRADFHTATALMRTYAARYRVEDFRVVALEQVLEGAIVNPATGACSRKLTFGGKVDGIVERGGEHFVLEHKVVARLDQGYVEQLWVNPQPVLYALYVQEQLGLPVRGVIWNLLTKHRLQQGRGETEEEYQRRRAELAARNKSGISRASRRLPESDEAFQARLAERYGDPLAFRRLELILDESRLEAVREQLWKWSTEFLEAKRRGNFYPNPSFCLHHGRPCPYLSLCRSGGDSIVAEGAYRRVPPHEELREPAEVGTAELPNQCLAGATRLPDGTNEKSVCS